MTRPSCPLFMLALALLAACGSDEPSSSPEPASDVTTASDATAPDASPTACPSGHIEGPDGACMAVGIQGCDDMFIDPETGLCDPSLVDCPLGSIPIFSGEEQGCLAVGIVDCHPDFLDSATGLCDPKPDACPEGSMPVPTQGCVSLDPPGGCGEGTWGNIEELPGDVHLDVKYTGGDSDGSREKPWSAFEYALIQVDPGGRLVLAAGDYNESLLIDESISVVGRCSSMVTISGVDIIEGTSVPAVVEVRGGVEVSIADIAVSGEGVGLTAHSGAKLELDRSSIVSSLGVGMMIGLLSTEVVARDVLIRDTQLEPGGATGKGVFVQDGAKLTLERAVLMANHGAGVMLKGAGAGFVGRDLLITGTLPTLNGESGRGLQVGEGAQAQLESVVLSDNRAYGVLAYDYGSAVEAFGLVVARTSPRSDETAGVGILVDSGASMTLESAIVTESHGAGLISAQGGSRILATHTLVSKTQFIPGGVISGAKVLLGAELTLDRALLTENDNSNLLAKDPGSIMNVSETLVTRARSPESGAALGSLGGWVDNEAQLTLERSAVTECEGGGLLSDRAGSSLRVTDSFVGNNRVSPLDSNWLFGFGALVMDGAQGEFTGVAVTKNDATGITFMASGGSVIETLIERSKNRTSNWATAEDGLLVTGSVVESRGIVARLNQRAGVLYDRSGGELSGSLITDNLFGLVNQGLPGVNVAQDNAIEGNDQNLIEDGELEVQDQPIDLPDIPDFER